MPVLPVAFYTQLGYGYNLCSQACIAMATATLTAHKPASAKAVAVATGTNHGEPIGFTDLIRMGAHYGVKLTYYGKADLAWARRMIDERRPPILLIDYRQLSTRPNKSYTAAHFVVAIGYNETSFILHDPLQTAGHFIVPAADLEKALNTPSQISGYTNRPNQAVYPSELTVPMTISLDFTTGFNLDFTGFGFPGGPDRLSIFKDTGAVRIPLDISMDTGNEDVELALDRIQPYLDKFAVNGLTPVFVNGHELWGEGKNFDWERMRDITWPNYVSEWQRWEDGFIEANRRVLESLVRRYRGKKYFQMGNQSDAFVSDSVYIPPKIYGRIYRRWHALVLSFPDCIPMTAGFSSGAGIAIEYLLLAGITTIPDVIVCVHPYEKRPAGYAGLINGDSLEAYFAMLRSRFPSVQFCVTEFAGIRGALPFDDLARFHDAFWKTTAALKIPAIAYPGIRGMHGCEGPTENGMVIAGSQGQTIIGIAQKHEAGQTVPDVPTEPPMPAAAPYKLRNVGSSGVRLRTKPGLTQEQLGVLYDGQTVWPMAEVVTITESDPRTGRIVTYRWRHFMTGGRDGYIAVAGNGLSITLEP